MEISNRIRAIVEELEYNTVADIGCDHGYISIYAVSKHNIEKAIACDINIGPLQKAKENIKHLNYTHKIETRLCYGLEKISKGEVEAVIIAGMGGGLMIEILQNAQDIIQNVKQLILQPQSEIHKVRKYLHGINYKIVNEKIIFDENKFYTILNCSIGLDIPYSTADYFLGRMEFHKENIIFKYYLETEVRKTKNILADINMYKKDKSNERKDFLVSLLEMYEEAIKCMQQ